jgi:hypothetical protein
MIRFYVFYLKRSLKAVKSKAIPKRTAENKRHTSPKNKWMLGQKTATHQDTKSPQKAQNKRSVAFLSRFFEQEKKMNCQNRNQQRKQPSHDGRTSQANTPKHTQISRQAKRAFWKKGNQNAQTHRASRFHGLLGKGFWNWLLGRNIRLATAVI